MRRKPARSAIAVPALGAALLAGPAFAGPPLGPGSTAYGIYVQITEHRNAVTLGPIAEIARNLPPAYDKAVVAAPVHRIVPLIAGKTVTPSLFLNAADFESHVASKGFGIDFVSTEADTLIKNINLSLMLNPPPPIAGHAILPQPQPFLQLSARHIASTASFTKVVPSRVTDLGSARFGGLTISGTLVGNRKLAFTGDADQDTILFQSPTVTITLNQQTQVGLISCSPNCVFTPYSITIDAVDISLDHANIDGHSVSGEIVLGQAHAN
ncbi:MAG TPA: hypothetical protein VGF34_16315 [Stellaceae bacterium]|jgi:hypothetical protein